MRSKRRTDPKQDREPATIREYGEVTLPLSRLRLAEEPVVPEMAADEHKALVEDIRVNGLRIPLVVDGEGLIWDGRARYRACLQVGIEDVPVIVVLGMTEEEGRREARTLNALRRHLNQAQKRVLIADQLRETPEVSDNAIATMFAVDGHTVRAVRRTLVANGEIPAVDTVVGRNGQRQPARKQPRPSVFVPDAAGLAGVLDAAKVVDFCDLQARIHTAGEIESIARTSAGRKQRRENEVAGEPPNEGGTIDMMVVDATIAPRSAADYREIAELAVRALKPGAPIVLVVPKPGLPDAIGGLGSKLTYTWAFAERSLSAKPVAKPIPVEDGFRLILMFRKAGPSHKQALLPDLFESAADGPTAILSLIESYTHVGDMVLDFSESPEVAAACRELGRRVIDEACPAILRTEGDDAPTDAGDADRALSRRAPSPRHRAQSDQLEAVWESPRVVGIRDGDRRIALLPVERVAKGTVIKRRGNAKVDHAGVIVGLANACFRSALPHEKSDLPCFCVPGTCRGCYANDTRWAMRGPQTAVHYDVISNGLKNDRATVRLPKDDDYSLASAPPPCWPPLYRVHSETTAGDLSIALGLMQNYAEANPEIYFFTFCGHAFRPGDDALARLASLKNTWVLHTLSGYFSERELDVRLASFERFIDFGIPSVAYLVTSSLWQSETVLDRTLKLVGPELIIEEPLRINNGRQEGPTLGSLGIGACSQTHCSECPLRCGWTPLVQAGLLKPPATMDIPPTSTIRNLADTAMVPTGAMGHAA